MKRIQKNLKNLKIYAKLKKTKQKKIKIKKKLFKEKLRKIQKKAKKKKMQKNIHNNTQTKKCFDKMVSDVTQNGLIGPYN